MAAAAKATVDRREGANLGASDMAADPARQLWLMLGPEAAPAVALCLEDCNRLGDKHAMRFWTDVAERLRAMMRGHEVSPGGSAAELAPASRTWLLMQRIELYRHRALRAARKAARSEAHRGEVLEIVAQWLDLANLAERLAQDAEVLGAYRNPERLRN